MITQQIADVYNDEDADRDKEENWMEEALKLIQFSIISDSAAFHCWYSFFKLKNKT